MLEKSFTVTQIGYCHICGLSCNLHTENGVSLCLNCSRTRICSQIGCLQRKSRSKCVNCSSSFSIDECEEHKDYGLNLCQKCSLLKCGDCSSSCSESLEIWDHSCGSFCVECRPKTRVNLSPMILYSGIQPAIYKYIDMCWECTNGRSIEMIQEDYKLRGREAVGINEEKEEKKEKRGRMYRSQLLSLELELE